MIKTAVESVLTSKSDGWDSLTQKGMLLPAASLVGAELSLVNETGL